MVMAEAKTVAAVANRSGLAEQEVPGDVDLWSRGMRESTLLGEISRRAGRYASRQVGKTSWQGGGQEGKKAGRAEDTEQ